MNPDPPVTRTVLIATSPSVLRRFDGGDSIASGVRRQVLQEGCPPHGANESERLSRPSGAHRGGRNRSRSQIRTVVPRWASANRLPSSENAPPVPYPWTGLTWSIFDKRAPLRAS